MLIRSLYVFLGMLLRGISVFIKPKKDIWIFGAQSGQRFTDNSKYFFLYVRNTHSEKKVVWIARSKSLIHELKNEGYIAYSNFSLKGLYYILYSEAVFFCTSRNDVLFVYPRVGRKIVNLWHGMPMKKIVYDFPAHRLSENRIKTRLWDYFVVGFKHKNVNLIPATSDFFAPILESAFRNQNIFITGQPRTDGFFSWDNGVIRKKLGFQQDEKIVTYMPTHRNYGRGKLNPFVFIDNEEAIKIFQNNKIKVVWKFHKNMSKVYIPVTSISDVFIDITQAEVDPQELLFVTDILITDYSSCYIDYLMLNRPVIFYFYDNYTQDDNELYYKPLNNREGKICFNENEVLDAILNPKFPECEFYHQYRDSNSSKRVMQIVRRL